LSTESRGSKNSTPLCSIRVDFGSKVFFLSCDPILSSQFLLLKSILKRATKNKNENNLERDDNPFPETHESQYFRKTRSILVERKYGDIWGIELQPSS
jgi:hypothetical protein